MTDMVGGSSDEIEHQLEAEFLDEARDTVNTLDVLLGNVRSLPSSADEALSTLRRNVHNLRQWGGNVTMPAITVITNRMEDYVGGVKALGARELADIQAFVDKLRAVLDGDMPSGDELIRTMARELPVKVVADFDVKDITWQNVEVMLVVQERAMSTIVQRELQACGYRVSNCRNPFSAIEMVVRTRPDLVIIGATQEGVTGIDLACALSAMPSTGGVPVAVLTSYSWGHPSLEGLPPRVAILRKGATFGDDLAESLARFKIT